MKTITFLFLCLFLPFVGRTQSKLKSGLVFSSSYDFTKINNQTFLYPNAKIKNSVNFDLGGFTSWQPLDKLRLNAKLVYSYHKMRLSYLDQDKLDSLENNFIYTEENPILYTDEASVKIDRLISSLKLPVSLQLMIFKNFFVSGGVGLEFYLTNLFKNNSEPYISFGIGTLGNKLSWELTIERPLNQNALKGEKYIAQLNKTFTDYLTYTRRQVKFSIIYHLFPNKKITGVR